MCDEEVFCGALCTQLAVALYVSSGQGCGLSQPSDCSESYLGVVLILCATRVQSRLSVTGRSGWSRSSVTVLIYFRFQIKKELSSLERNSSDQMTVHLAKLEDKVC